LEDVNHPGLCYIQKDAKNSLEFSKTAWRPKMSRIRVLLVDEHSAVRSGLKKFILVNKDLEAVGEATDGEEAVQMSAIHKPDVILMDLMRPGMDGITATREIHRQHPDIKIITLTSFSEQKMVEGALNAGAIGYLQKNITAAELKNAIYAAHAGQMTLSPEVMQAVA
jgi:DNA-binding NarL/FixJ family response regulator